MRNPRARRAGGAVLPAACSLASVLLVAGAAAPAFATGDDTYTVQLRQQLPRTATTDDDGADQKSRDECPGVPDGQDGWHFVLPTKKSDFVKLTVTFEPGGEQELTVFGPPNDKHAYVWSEPGAELTSAVAEVRGGDLEKFNLSHTCPVTVTDDTETGGSDDTDTDTDADDTDDSDDTDETDETETDTSASPTPGTSTEPTTEPDSEPTAGESADEGASPAASPQGDTGGDLAETGSSAPVGILSAAAAALLGAGGYLVFRRRKAGAQG
ncbi:LPXTG cell wall anchor domain-containing protein [Streptomyces sp. NPDC002845]